jgi:hypothetical protein
MQAGDERPSFYFLSLSLSLCSLAETNISKLGRTHYPFLISRKRILGSAHKSKKRKKKRFSSSIFHASTHFYDPLWLSLPLSLQPCLFPGLSKKNLVQSNIRLLTDSSGRTRTRAQNLLGKDKPFPLPLLAQTCRPVINILLS